MRDGYRAAMRREVTRHPPRSILVIKPSSFGDVVHTLPAAARLKLAWPSARLTWVINPEWAPLLSENPFVDEILPFPRREFRGVRGVVGFWRWCQEVIAPQRPDLAIDFQGLLRSAWVGRASKAGCYVGMSDAREGARWFYDHISAMPRRPEHAVNRYLAVADDALKLYPGQTTGHDTRDLVWPLPGGQSVELGGVAQEKFILLHPFARGAGKSLTEGEILRICREVAPRPVVLVGQQGGKTLSGLPDHCFDLLNQTSLEQLIWLIRKAAFVVTVDSGPAHLASALKRPMVAIHTWSDPRLVGPFWEEAWVWKNGQLIQVQALATAEQRFFRPQPLRMGTVDVQAVCALATSS